MNNIDSFNLIVVCVTIIAALKIIVEFIKFLIKRNDPLVVKETFVDELISQEIYFEIGDQEPYFKRLKNQILSYRKMVNILFVGLLQLIKPFKEVLLLLIGFLVGLRSIMTKRKRFGKTLLIVLLPLHILVLYQLKTLFNEA